MRSASIRNKNANVSFFKRWVTNEFSATVLASVAKITRQNSCKSTINQYDR